MNTTGGDTVQCDLITETYLRRKTGTDFEATVRKQEDTYLIFRS